MATNLREEIQNLDHDVDGQNLLMPDDEVEAIIELFKKYALEMVGEDLEHNLEEPRVDVFNKVKREIRQRIEEAIK